MSEQYRRLVKKISEDMRTLSDEYVGQRVTEITVYEFTRRVTKILRRRRATPVRDDAGRLLQGFDLELGRRMLPFRGIRGQVRQEVILTGEIKLTPRWEGEDGKI